MPASRAARIIDALGIVVNRTTWRNYVDLALPAIPTTDIFGMRLPSSILTISTLAATNVGNNTIEAAKTLAACGFPSGFRPQIKNPLLTGSKNDSPNLQHDDQPQQHPDN
jgi:hypothetical protein